MSAPSQKRVIPYGRHYIDSDDEAAVLEVLRSGFLTTGPKVPEFEDVIKAYCSAEHAVAMNSATSALHVGCLALGVSLGDIVWTTAISFVASANCAKYCGAEIDFVDIDYSTNNMCLIALEAKLKLARAQNQLPKLVIPVHMGGTSCDMKTIRQLSNEYGFLVLEDASHALGGDFSGDKVGACTYSDAAVFSFHPVKMITSIEGGMLVTNDKEVAKQAFLLRSHGIERDKLKLKERDFGPWHYEQTNLGFNYRLNDIQAALGISQMGKLDMFVAERNTIADRYYDQLKNLPLTLPVVSPDTLSSYHLFIVKVDAEQVKLGKNEIFRRLHDAGVLVQLHYIPIYRHPFYGYKNIKSGDFPGSEAFYQTALSLPIYYGLTEEDQVFCCEQLKQVLG